MYRLPIAWLSLGDSPRLDGQNEAHLARLAEIDGPLPPILVERRTMRVIDGAHRLVVASMKGWEAIDVEFWEGSAADAFLTAVESNVRHGYPLSQNDRRAAAARIIASHPHLSDRAIAHIAGLGAKSVASIRRASGHAAPQPGARVGRDGRVRPLNSVEGRLKAAGLFTEHPQASLREVARIANISPATAGDVRKRLERGEAPVSSPARGRREVRRPNHIVAASAVQNLVRDPSLRNKEEGRRLLRLLQHCAMGSQEWDDLIAAVPAHCTPIVQQLALQYAQTWSMFAKELAERTRTGPSASGQAAAS